MIAAQVVYHDVPAAVARVSTYQWQPGSRPVPLPLSVDRTGRQWTISVEGRAVVIVVLERADGAYLLDGPIAPRDEVSERTLDHVWRRTAIGSAAPGVAGMPPIAWLPLAGNAGDTWPACWWTDASSWQCFGIALGAGGIAVAAGADHVLSAPVLAGSPAVLRSSRWARLVIATDRSGAAVEGLQLSAARPVTPPPQRNASVRVETSPVSGVSVTMTGPGVAWIAGDSSPPAAWIEVRGTRAGPVYRPLSEIAAGSPLASVPLSLEETRVVDAKVLAATGDPAPGTLVTTYRLIDPSSPSRDGRDPPPRRVFVAETLADDSGGARLEGLGVADYEVVAWHPQFGRASLLLAEDTDRATIRLRSAGIARGRVVAGGRPLAGVDVISVPDPAAYVAVQDPLDVKGGDARTGADGRFWLALAPGGGGELRIGGGSHPVRRVPLPRGVTPIVDLGDIELGRPVTLSVVLDQDVPCGVRATGPIGRAGLQIVNAIRVGPGLFSIELPEEGSWEFGLLCGRAERSVTPAVVSVSAGQREVRLLVR